MKYSCFSQAHLILFRKTLAHLVVLGLWFSSCSMLTPTTSDEKSSDYSISFNVPGWQRMSSDGSDHAFTKAETNSIMVMNTVCNKYELTSLEQLTLNALASLSDVQIVTQEKVTYSGRDALRTNATGQLDGVTVSMELQTLKKNRCVYDIFLISQNEDLLKTDMADFEKLLSSIDIK